MVSSFKADLIFHRGISLQMELNKNIFISEIEECSSQYSLNLGDLLKVFVQ